MIDIAKYAGVDDSNFAIKLGMADKLTCDKWDSGGALVGVTYYESSLEEREHNRERIIAVASQIATRIKSGKI